MLNGGSAGGDCDRVIGLTGAASIPCAALHCSADHIVTQPIVTMTAVAASGVLQQLRRKRVPRSWVGNASPFISTYTSEYGPWRCTPGGPEWQRYVACLDWNRPGTKQRNGLSSAVCAAHAAGHAIGTDGYILVRHIITIQCLPYIYIVRMT